MTRNNRILGCFLVILLLCCIASITAFFWFPFVSQDSGYYLSTMRDMHQGHLYFIDIAAPYNPLAIAILSLPYVFVTTTIVSYHLLVNLLILGFCSLFLFKILKRFNLSIWLNLFLTVSFLMMCLLYDGNHIMLEPVSILFQLLALQCYLIFRKKEHFATLFLCGSLLGLSFLAKQYGLFLLLPIGLDILLSNGRKLKQIAILSFGILLPVVLLYVYYAYYDTSLIQFVIYILGKGQTFDHGTGTGIHTGFKLTHLLDCFLYIPFVFAIPFLMKKSNYREMLFYSVLAFSSLSIFIFGSYDHYFQYIFPYFIILFAFATTTSKKFVSSMLFYLIVVVGIVRICSKTVSTIKHQKIDYQLQQTNLIKLKNAVPKNASVYLNGISCAYYYLADYHSINLSKIGYAFPGYFYPETIISTMEPNSYLIVTQNYLDEYQGLTDEFTKETIEFRNEDDQIETIYIFQKR